MRYRLLGLDLDGTVLDPRGRVPAANVEAVARAAAAGLRVVVCTGRAWRESRHVLEQLPDVEEGVFVTGAAVCRAADGEGLDLSVIEPSLARRLVDHLHDAPEAVLVFQDAQLAGHDYLVTGRGELTGNTEWWFQHTGARVRFHREVTEDDLHHTLRVGVVAPAQRAAEIEATLVDDFTDEIFFHSFEAVTGTGEGHAPIHVLEIFAAGVNKWRGLSFFTERDGIDASEVAVIGDSTNDVAMVEQAGCGIAMANAIDAVKQAASWETASNTEEGVARAIERLLEG